MLVPLSWLKKFISFSLSDEALAEVLTLAGLEVDKVERTFLPFRGVVVGEVLETSPHPNADKLKIAQVSNGKDTVQVVCGDPCCEKGMKVAFAEVGAELQDKAGKSFKIKKAKLRDVESYGMLCSEEELGLKEHADSIMRLPDDLPLGKPLTELFEDTIFEISLTPNLGHCMSILGIARDLAAMLDLKIKQSPIKLEGTEKSSINDVIKVTVQNPEDCSRYSCRLIRNVTVGPSPFWLQKRLESVGMRPLNNIVDVTNYIMFERGQPLHAFDYAAIEGQQITVKLTHEKESFITLDGETRSIDPGTLIIYDKSKPLAIAGVMGGSNSEVKQNTSDILLEAAHFNSSTVRRASKSLYLRSDSSARFERGIDHEGVLRALDEAALLIQQLAGGEIVKDSIDISSHAFKPRTICCRINRINQLLGTHLSLSEIESFLNRLEMQVKNQDESTLLVTVPSYRNDIHAEIDLIEEIARVYGYNNIQKGEGRVINSSLPHASLYLAENKIRCLLLREGLQEFLTSDLISPELSKLSLDKAISGMKEIPVLQPSSVDQSILRTSLLPGLLQATKQNFDRGHLNFSVFEMGRIHFKDGDQYKERATVSILLTGKQKPNHWENKNRDVDFYDLKGILENIFVGLGIPDVRFSKSNLQCFHPGKQATIHAQKVQIGALGEIHPTYLDRLDLNERLFFAELDLHDIMSVSQESEAVSSLSQFPSSDRDWTLTLRKDEPNEILMDKIRNFKSNLLKDFFLLDLYESEKLGPDQKNVTLRFIYRDDQKTITQEEVEKEHARLIQAVEKQMKSVL